MRRRDKAEIIASILNVCISGSNKTRIVYQANLNFRTINPYLNLLEQNGLIEITKNKMVFYKTTEKGKEWINDYANINNILKI